MTDTSDYIKIFFRVLLMQLPTLIVCLVACFVILTMRKPASRSLFWAILGFGSALVLCVVMPVVQTILESWVSRTNAERASAYFVFSIVWAVLRAITYVFLLIAVVDSHFRRPANH